MKPRNNRQLDADSERYARGSEGIEVDPLFSDMPLVEAIAMAYRDGYRRALADWPTGDRSHDISVARRNR